MVEFSLNRIKIAYLEKYSTTKTHPFRSSLLNTHLLFALGKRTALSLRSMLRKDTPLLFRPYNYFSGHHIITSIRKNYFSIVLVSEACMVFDFIFSHFSNIGFSMSNSRYSSGFIMGIPFTIG